MIRSSNPALSDDTFSKFGYIARSDAMTVQGTIAKTLFLLLCTLLTAGWTWIKFFKTGSQPAAVAPLMTIGGIGGFILALITVFKIQWAPVTSIFYALLEGLFIGGLSATLEASFPGIAIQATALTFGTLAAMLFAYQSGLIRATEKFKIGIVAATGGIALLYIVSIILSFFHINIPFIYGNGAFGIGFSIVVVIIAALNFIIDFDFIEQGVARGAPKYMEWYGAFAMMVTLIWLYIEILRLLSKLRER